MPKQTLASHHRLYEDLIQEDKLQSIAEEHLVKYPHLDIDHIKSLTKELTKLTLTVFSPVSCTHSNEKKRRIECLKDATFNDRELTIERRREFPSDTRMISLYFLRRNNEHNLKKVKKIFEEDGLSTDHSSNYFPLIQNDLIPKISSHIINIVKQQDLEQTKTIQKIISRGPRSTPIESILEEREDDSKDGKPSTPPLLKQSSTKSLSDSTNSSPEQQDDINPKKSNSQWQDAVGRRSTPTLSPSSSDGSMGSK
jgi:hypothetical protein